MKLRDYVQGLTHPASSPTEQTILTPSVARMFSPCQTFLYVGGFIALLLFPSRADPQGATRPGLEITGIVADVSTGAPISGAAVRIRGTTVAAVTDASGRFVLREVPAGEQTWVIESLGYATWQQPLTAAHMDRLRIGLMPRPIALKEIRVAASRLESRRRLAGVSVTTVGEDIIRGAVASDAAGLVRSRMPWIPASCPPVGPGGSPSLDARLCLKYRGGSRTAAVCLDERPAAMEELLAYAPDEIHAVDYVGGPHPHVRVYTIYFLESGRKLRPLSIGCRP